MDVIASHRAGVRHVVATSGTALTTEHAALLKRYAPTVALCLDQDVAGTTAAKRSVDILLRAGLAVLVIMLPEGVKDPDECVQKDSASWQEAVANAVPFFSYLFTDARKKNLNDVQEKKHVAQELLGFIAKLPDPVERGHYVKELATLLNVQETFLYEALPKERSSFVSKPEPEKPSGRTGQDRHTSFSERCMALLAKHPHHAPRAFALLSAEALVAGPLRDLYTDLKELYTLHDSPETLLQDFFNKRKATYDRLTLSAEHFFGSLDAVAIEHELETITQALMRDYLRFELQQCERHLQETTDSRKTTTLLERVDVLNRRLAEYS